MRVSPGNVAWPVGTWSSPPRGNCWRHTTPDLTHPAVTLHLSRRLTFVGGHSLLQGLHARHGEVPLSQPRPVQVVVARLLPLVSVVSEEVKVPVGVGEELQAHTAVLAELICCRGSHHPPCRTSRAYLLQRFLPSSLQTATRGYVNIDWLSDYLTGLTKKNTNWFKTKYAENVNLFKTKWINEVVWLRSILNIFLYFRRIMNAGTQPSINSQSSLIFWKYNKPRLTQKIMLKI